MYCLQYVFWIHWIPALWNLHNRVVCMSISPQQMKIYSDGLCNSNSMWNLLDSKQMWGLSAVYISVPRRQTTTGPLSTLCLLYTSPVWQNTNHRFKLKVLVTKLSTAWDWLIWIITDWVTDYYWIKIMSGCTIPAPDTAHSQLLQHLLLSLIHI